MPRRLTEDEVASVLHAWPDDLNELALELRAFVLRVAPELDEQIAFHALCYSVPGRPYGVIGGNACAIGRKGDAVHLGFLHGAFLADPEGLLQGTGKAKRHIELRSTQEVPWEALEQLLRASISHDPSA
jgi:hypothetical protein